MNKFAPFTSFFFCILFICNLFCSVSASSELVEDSWNMKASMNQARAGLGVVSAGGKIYAIGGSILPNIQNGSLVNTNEQYNPKTDTWITLAPMPTPRAYFAIVTYQGKIYCIGGAVGFAIEWWGIHNSVCGVNEVYDIENNRWSIKASPPFNGANLQAHVIDKQIFVLHGRDLYMYNPATDSWTNKTSMPMPPREGFNPFTVSAVVDNKIIVAGEFEPEPNQFEQRLIIYEPKIDEWIEGRQDGLPVAFSKAAAGVTTGTYAPQKIYVLEFMRYYPVLFGNQVYDPISYSWSVAKSMPTDRKDFGVAVVDDVLYVVGGSLYEGQTVPLKISAINEQYVPIGYDSVPIQTESFLMYLIGVILVLLLGVVVLFLYVKRRKSVNNMMTIA
jgi:N-acetylneuraminic acid mutarotase